VSEQGKAMFAKFDAELKAYDALVPDMLKRVEAEALQDDSATVKYFFGTFRNRANAVDDMITELSKLKEQNAKAADDETNQLYADSRNFMILLVIGALGAGVALGVMASRSITRPLEQAVALAAKVAEGDLSSDISVHSKDEIGQLLQALSNMNGSLSRIVSDVRAGTQTIATASSQIASGSLDLSSRTEEQASSLEETASSMEELTSTVKQNADNARQARQLAESASQVAQKGGSVVAEVVTTMEAISGSSAKIVDIIGVIDGIAFQTNILALNAAVEAARAGEQGRGFAVVASEVRNLAQRSAAAAKEIKVLIDGSAHEVETGSRLVGTAGTTMGEIVASIQRVTDIMAEISAASQEQTIGIEQINEAVLQMDQVTQQNAALVEEASAASESMQEEASKLEGLVASFRLAADRPAAAAGSRAAVRLQPASLRMRLA
jgi:methyl-accepting chemotaxis protein